MQSVQQTEQHVEAATQETVTELRCWRCNRKLAELVTSPWQIRCVRCKAVNQHP